MGLLMKEKVGKIGVNRLREEVFGMMFKIGKEGGCVLGIEWNELMDGKREGIG